MSGSDMQMARLRLRFVERAAGDSAAITAALQGGDRARLLQLAHGLAGIAGIFGYGEIGAHAAALEEAVEKGLADAALENLGGALVAALNRVAQAD